jgi:hypothetical protein
VRHGRGDPRAAGLRRRRDHYGGVAVLIGIAGALGEVGRSIGDFDVVLE